MVKIICNKKTLKTYGTVALCLLKFIALLIGTELTIGVISVLICDHFKMSKMLNNIITGDITQIFIIVFGYIYYSKHKESMIECCEIRKTSWSNLGKALLLGFCMVAVSGILTSAIVGVLHLHSESYEEVKAAYNFIGSNILLSMSPIILAPIVEELLCRGMLFNRLQRIVNIKVAIVIQALFFAFMHGNSVQFGYTFLMGIMAGCLVYYTKSIFTSMMFHFGNNLFALVITSASINEIIKGCYVCLAPILCIYIFMNIRKCSRFNIA